MLRHYSKFRFPVLGRPLAASIHGTAMAGGACCPHVWSQDWISGRCCQTVTLYQYHDSWYLST